MATGVIIPDQTAGHPELLRTDDLVLLGDDTGTGRHVDAVGHAPDLVKDQRVEHVDTLGDDDGVLVALHLLIAAGLAGLEVVPGDVHLPAVSQLAQAGDQQIHVDAVG